jgi:uncharacterized protein YhjY with autotransporter beta-barrel domain
MYYDSGDGQSGAPNTTLAQALAVDLQAASSDGQTVSVTWTVLKGNATIQESHGATYTDSTNLPSGSSVSTSSSIHIALGATPGPVLVRAYCGDCQQSGSLDFRYDFNLTIEQPTLAIVSGNDQTGAANAHAAAPLVVQVSANGKPVANQTVTWSIASGQATLSATSSVTDANGNASVNFTYGANAGPIAIQASVPGSQVTFNATVTVPMLTVQGGNNQTGPTGTEGTSPLSVRVADTNGTPLAGQTVSWSVASGQATLVGSSSISDANGNASIGFVYGSAAGTSTILATLGSAQASFTVTAYTPALSAISGSSQTGPVGTTLQPFVVQIGPAAGGNSRVQSSTPAALAGIAVSWTVLQGGGTLASAQTVTDASGKSSNTLTLGSNPGTNLVQASIPGVGSITFSAIAIPAISGTSTTFTIVSGNNQNLVPNQPSQPLVVKLASSTGTPIPGAAIQWSVTGATGALANPTSTTGADGTAQNTLTVVLPGSYTVSAQVAGVQGIAPLTFNFSNGVANLPGLSPTQVGVATAIDKACPALATSTAPLTPQQQDFLQRCSEVVVGANGDPQQVSGALSAMLNNKALPQRSLAQGVQTGQIDNLNTRFAELRQGATGFSAGGLTLNQDGRGLPLAMLGDLFRKDPATNDEVGKDFSRWGFFATGMIERGGFDATAVRPGFDFHSASLTAGVDYRFNDSFVAGAALGYNQNNSSFDANAGKADVDGYNLTGYFSWYRGDWYVEGSLILNKLDYDLSRNIAYQIASLSGGTTTITETAMASPSGNQNSLSLSAGRDFNRKAWTISPYLRGVYSHLSLDGFSETMANPNAAGAGLGTSVASRSMNSMLGVAGARVSYTLSTDWGVLVPNAVVEWNHEFRNDPQTVVVRFLADPTQTPISLTDQTPDSNYFNLGLGLNAVFAQGRSAYVYYEHMAGYAGAHSNQLSLGIRIEF